MLLSPKSQRWLKLAHIFTVSCWIGGCCSILLLSALKFSIDDGRVLFGIHVAALWIDWVVIIIPGALGCLITGLLYSMCTPWGFIKHRWIIVKWFLTIAMILYGTFVLGPSKTEMYALNKELQDAIFESSRFAALQLRHILLSPPQLIILLITVYISIFKPWRKKTPPQN